jgi:hypothetical protein
MNSPWLRIVRAAGVFVLGIGLLLALAHSAPVRARVLAWGLGRLAPFGVQGRAGRLDYNLLRLEVRVYDIALAATGQQDKPFFTADEVEVKLGWPMLAGLWSIKAIESAHPRFAYVQSAAGVSNLPDLNRSSDRTVGARIIERLALHNLEVSWHDDTKDMSFDLRSASIDLSPERGIVAGPVAIGSAVFRIGTRTTTLQRAGGSLAYDGFALRISDFNVSIPEGSVAVSGGIDSLWSTPMLSVSLQGSADLRAVASWMSLAPAPTGQATFSGTASGAPSNPSVTLTVSSTDATWGRFARTSGTATVALTDSAVDIRSLAWRLVGGEASGQGHFSFGDSVSANSLRLSWRDLDAAALISAVMPNNKLRVSSRLDGRLDARWPSRSFDQLTATVESQARIPDRSARGVRGSLRIDARNGRWNLTVDHWLDNAVRVSGAASGQIRISAPGATPLNGQLEVDAADIERAWDAVHRAGLVADRSSEHIDGNLHAAIALSGTINDPHADVDLESDNLRVREAGPGSVRAGLTISSAEVGITSLDARVGDDTLHATGRFVVDSRRVEGRAEWTIPTLESLTKTVSPEWRPAGSTTGQASIDGRWPAPTIRLSFSGTDLKAAGQQIDRWSSDVHIEGQTVWVDRLDVEQMDGRLSLSGEYHPNDGAYSLHAAGRRVRVDPIPRAGGSGDVVLLQGRFDVDFDGEGSLAEPQGRGRINASALTWNQWEVGPLQGDVTLDRGTLTADIRAPRYAGTVHAQLGVAPLEHFEINGEIQNLDLSRLLSDSGHEDLPITGTVGVTAQAVGEWTDLQHATVTGSVVRLEGRIGGVSVQLDRSARISYREEELVFDPLALHLGTTSLAIEGQLGTNQAGSVRASMDGQLSDLAAIAQTVQAYRHQPPLALDATGAIRLNLTATGTLSKPVFEADLATTSGRVTGGKLLPATIESLIARYRDGVLTIERLEGGWQMAHVSATGALPARLLDRYLPGPYIATLPATSTPARLSLVVDPITASVLASFSRNQICRKSTANSRRRLRSRPIVSLSRICAVSSGWIARSSC